MFAIESLITSNRQQSPGQPSGLNEAVCRRRRRPPPPPPPPVCMLAAGIRTQPN